MRTRSEHIEQGAGQSADFLSSPERRTQPLYPTDTTKDIGSIALQPTAIDQLTHYSRAWGLLDKEQAAELCKTIEAGVFAQAYLDGEVDLENGYKKFQALQPTAPELQELVQQGEDAFNKMIACNIRLVMKIAHRVAKPRNVKTYELEESVQDGMFGLMRAIEMFDHQKGYTFSTYASNWILQAISREHDNNSRAIRIPIHASDDARKMAGAERSLEEKLGYTPGVAETAESLGWSHEKAQDVKDYRNMQPFSIDIPYNPSEHYSETIGDMLADEYELSSPDSAFTYFADNDVLTNVLADLSARERYIVTHHFGLQGGEPKDFTELAEAIGGHATPLSVSSWLQDALAKLKANPETQELLSA